jgi:hypothetical protein
MFLWLSTVAARLSLRLRRANSQFRGGEVTGWLRAVNRFALTLTIWTYSRRAWHLLSLGAAADSLQL